MTSGRRTDLSAVVGALLALCLVAGLMIAAPQKALGNEKSLRDPNDVPSALDIRRLSHRHSGDLLVHDIQMHDAFDPRILGKKYVAYMPIYFGESGVVVQIFWQRGLKVRMMTSEGELRVRASAKKPDRRTLRVIFPSALISDGGGYRWAAVTGALRGSGCICDSAPQGLDRDAALLHDFSSPTIEMKSFPDPSTNESATETVTVAFVLRDTGGAGIRRWMLQSRVQGTEEWTTEAEGSGEGEKSPSFKGEQGTTYDLRVVAVDGQANETVSATQHISVPIDDDSEELALAFDSTWTVDGTTADFLGTLHTSSIPGSTFAHSFTGSYFALIGPGREGAVVDVTIDGTPETVDLGAFSGPRRVLFEKVLSFGPHVVTISPRSGEVSIDAIVIR